MNLVVCIIFNHASVHVWIMQGETSTIRREQQLVQVKGKERSVTQQQPRQQVSFSGARQTNTIYLKGCFEALIFSSATNILLVHYTHVQSTIVKVAIFYSK